MKETAIGMSFLLLGFFAVVMWPMALIWSVNSLFSTEIPLNFKTWLATMILSAFLKANFGGKDS